MPQTDPLLRFRDEFPILARSTYLVSNSLGAMPRAVPARLAEYAEAWAKWGVQAWARGWWEMPLTVGDAIAPLLGAAPHEVAMAPTVTLAQAAILSAMEFRAGRDTRGSSMQLLVFLFAWLVAIAVVVYLAWRKRDL